MYVAVFAIFRRVDDGDDAAGVADGAAGFEIADHADEVGRGIERVFLQRLQRGDSFLIEIEAVIGLTHVDIERQRIERRQILGANFAVGLRHDDW